MDQTGVRERLLACKKVKLSNFFQSSPLVGIEIDTKRKLQPPKKMDKMKIKIPKAKIAAFCKRWNVSELAIFGSALRPDFRATSDVNVLVSFKLRSHVTLFDMALM